MFKSILKAAALLSIGFLIPLTGCGKQPKPANFQFSFQKKIQAANHWEIMAYDLASDIQKSGPFYHVIGNTVSIVPNDNSPFTKAFRSFLTTYFVNKGNPVNDKFNDTKINWTLQLVEHEANRRPDQYPGMFTMAYALGYGVYKVWDNSSSVAPGILAAAVAADITRQVVDLGTIKVPKNEIIVNFTVIDAKDNMVYRKSDIYYINDLDKSQYCFSSDVPYQKATTKRYIVTD